MRDGLGAIRPNGGTDLRQQPHDRGRAAAPELGGAEAHHPVHRRLHRRRRLRRARRRGRRALRRTRASRSRSSPPARAPPTDLEEIAEAGHGRFYPGRDLQEIPQLMMEEAVLASRDFVNEGEFLPEITSGADVVAELTESPPLLGYVATTSKPQASTLLRIGPDRDPLLATWQLGLGPGDVVDVGRVGAVVAAVGGVGRLRRVLVRRRARHVRHRRRRHRRAGPGRRRRAAGHRRAGGRLRRRRVGDGPRHRARPPADRGAARAQRPRRVHRRGAGRRRRHATPSARRSAPPTARRRRRARRWPRCRTRPSSSRASPTRPRSPRCPTATGGRGAIAAEQAFDEADLAGRPHATSTWRRGSCSPPACCGRSRSALSRLNLRGAAVAASARHGVAMVRWAASRLRPPPVEAGGDSASERRSRCARSPPRGPRHRWRRRRPSARCCSASRRSARSG